MKDNNDFIQFKRHVETAIYNYKNYKNKIPAHRERSIFAINNILSNSSLNMTQKARAIRNHYKNFHTGFLFWRTGRSELKNQLKEAVRPYLNAERNEAILEIHAQVSKENFRALGMKRS